MSCAFLKQGYIYIHIYICIHILMYIFRCSTLCSNNQFGHIDHEYFFLFFIIGMESYMNEI